MVLINWKSKEFSKAKSQVDFKFYPSISFAKRQVIKRDYLHPCSRRLIDTGVVGSKMIVFPSTVLRIEEVLGEEYHSLDRIIQTLLHYYQNK